MKHRPPFWTFFSLALLLAVGCNKQEPVSAYQAPKDPETVTWTVPDGWHALPYQHVPESQGMKVAGLLQYGAFAAGDDTAAPQVAVTTVFPDAPNSRDLLLNVNRWRGQLGLPPAEAAQLAELVVTSTANGNTIQWVDSAGSNRRMRAAIVPREDRIWFYKMTGPAEQVEAQKEKFDAFVKSAKYLTPAAQPLVASAAPAGGAGNLPAGHPQVAAGDTPSLPPGHPSVPAPTTTAAALPAGHPPLPAPGPSSLPAGHPPINQPPSVPTPFLRPPANPAPATAGAGVSGIECKLPAGWSELPNPSSMRVATLSTGGDKPAQVIISRLSANFGGMLMNFNRWRAEVGLAPIEDAAAVKESKIKIGDVDGALVDFSGPGRDGSPTRSLIARCTVGDSVWFFKILGPADTVTKQQKTFEEFLASVRIPAEGK